MAKKSTRYVCIECGSCQSRWLGRCPGCDSWDSLQEEVVQAHATAKPGSPASSRAIPLCEVEPRAEIRIPTGLDEFDRVLGGGLVPGSGILLAGEPGIGKSTLLLQAAQQLAARKQRFLYITGEESASQVKLRADRIGDSPENLLLLAECDLAVIERQILATQPQVVGIDSVQALRSEDVPSASGSVVQVREIAARLLALAREHHIPIILVGHVTKDGTIAGPRVLEHMVDGVLSFEGERTHGLRVLRGLKNRFGSTQEVGIFEMDGRGLHEVENPSRWLLGDRGSTSPGAATAAILEGSRPLLVEIQALVSTTSYGAPARKVSGVDATRLSMLAAVLQKRLDLHLGDQDIYLNAVGGVRVSTTSGDLAVTAAILSSLMDRPLDHQCVYCGEVGLLGEVRSVSGIPQRLDEASRLGFTRACIPRGSLPEPVAGLEVLEIADVGQLRDEILSRPRAGSVR